MIKKFLATCLLLVCFGSVLAEKEEKTYLCIAEVGGGIKFDEATKTWEGGRFIPSEKFLVKLNDRRYPRTSATVTLFGKEKPAYGCNRVENRHVCNKSLGQFIFIQETLRFLAAHMSGYIEGDDAPKYTPFIQAGTCSPL